MTTTIGRQPLSKGRKHASSKHQKAAPKVRTKRMAKGKYNGKPVYDAEEPLTIKISKADVAKGKAGDPDHCAAALALCRQEPILAAHVRRSRVFVEFEKRVDRYITPARLRQETISFDRGSPAKFMEGDYTLLPPTGGSLLGAEWRTGRGGGKDKRSQIHVPVEGARPPSRGRQLYNKQGNM